jgi:hypothetical protein
MRVIVRATEAILLAHGFTNAMLDAMVQDGMATAEQRAGRAADQASFGAAASNRSARC